MKVYCPSCGVSNPENSTFCVECGSKLQKPQSAAKSTPVTPQAVPTQVGKPKPNKLYRSRSNRVIAGVCAGVAENMNVDPTLVRIFAIFMLFMTGGMAFFAYIVMWAVVPEEPYLESIDNQNVVYR